MIWDSNYKKTINILISLKARLVSYDLKEKTITDLYEIWHTIDNETIRTRLSQVINSLGKTYYDFYEFEIDSSDSKKLLNIHNRLGELRKTLKPEIQTRLLRKEKLEEFLDCDFPD